MKFHRNLCPQTQLNEHILKERIVMITLIQSVSFALLYTYMIQVKIKAFHIILSNKNVLLKFLSLVKKWFVFVLSVFNITSRNGTQYFLDWSFSGACLGH